MINCIFKMLGIFAFYSAASLTAPQTALASEAGQADIGTAASLLTVQVDEKNPNLYAEPVETAEVIAQAEAGEDCMVLEVVDDEWLKVEIDSATGYLNTLKTAEAVEQEAEEAKAAASAALRQSIVEYALQFVGGRYVYGGTNPNRGVDCSGFTSYVLKNIAGITLAHSSRTQSTQGAVISTAEARPGDLFFYASGRSIDHVALYIGDGQIVHASNERTGIVVSSASYRSPVKVVNVLGD